jgi:hypothetical protein
MTVINLKSTPPNTPLQLDLIHTALLAPLPRLSRRPLIRRPPHNAQPHASCQQKHDDQRAVQRKLGLMAQRREVGVAHVGRHREVLRERLAVLVLASPRLDRVEFGRGVVEDVSVDDGDEGEESGGSGGADGDEGAESRAVGEVDLGTVRSCIRL